jgi:hypothetical protein
MVEDYPIPDTARRPAIAACDGALHAMENPDIVIP